MVEPSSLHRLPWWEDALSTYLDRVREDPFVWGSHDCALFAASCVKAMTGVDPAEAYRGTYDTRQGSAKALRDLGSGTLLKTATAWFGEPIHPALARRGDLVMRDRTTLGVCAGAWSWFVGLGEQGQTGLVMLPTLGCRRAFQVPFAPAEVTGE